MTVKELIDDLKRFDFESPVIFEPAELTAIGLPQWSGANVRREHDIEDDRPTGRVIVKLKDMDED